MHQRGSRNCRIKASSSKSKFCFRQCEVLDNCNLCDKSCDCTKFVFACNSSQYCALYLPAVPPRECRPGVSYLLNLSCPPTTLQIKTSCLFEVSDIAQSPKVPELHSLTTVIPPSSVYAILTLSRLCFRLFDGVKIHILAYQLSIVSACLGVIMHTVQAGADTKCYF